MSSIRSLVGTDTHLVAGDRLPFPDATFDRVAVVDMLEHVPDDEAFAAELDGLFRGRVALVVRRNDYPVDPSVDPPNDGAPVFATAVVLWLFPGVGVQLLALLVAALIGRHWLKPSAAPEDAGAASALAVG